MVLGVVLFTIYNTQVKADPGKTARVFLASVRDGNFKTTVKQFGGNACRCPAKGGWVSYLIFASSQEPNLAFMMGQPFDYSVGEVIPIEASEEAKKGSVPWQAPEDAVVDVAIKFDEKKYMPIFLPVNMAYGKDISEEKFKEFIADPDKEAWKGFTLRLRPSLNKGVIDRPKESLGIKYKPSQKLREAGSKKKTDENDENYVYAPIEDMIRETLGEEGVMYLHPRDAAEVIKDDKSTYSKAAVLKKLPKLKSVNLRLHIVRRDQLKEWTVYHFTLTEPVLLLANGKSLELNNYRPRYNNDKWNRKRKLIKKHRSY